MRTFNYLLSALSLAIVLVVALFFLNPPTTFAQTCGGTPSCTAQQYADQVIGTYCKHDTTNDPNCSFPESDQFQCRRCLGYTDYNTGYTCRVNANSGACSSCVNDDQTCSGYNWYSNYAYYMYGNAGNITYVQCYQGVSILEVPTSTNGCSSNVDQKYCASGCQTYCNSSPSYGACTGLVEPANDCGTAYGSRSCTYTQPQTCTYRSCGTFSCSDFYDNCNYGAGFACVGGNTCEKTMGGRVTNTETGAGVSGVFISTTRGSDTTDANGYWSVGGFPYGTAFTMTPSASGYPCDSGYVCGGTSPTSPNPGSRSGTVGGGGDCGMSCNFTYTPGHIAGHVYIDYNHNGVLNTEDVGIANITVSADNPSKSDTTDGAGAYDISYLNDGAHTVTVTVPAGYRIVGSSSKSITIGPNDYGVDFYITPLYNIAGIVYNDFDAGDCYNPSSHGCTDKTTNPDTVHGTGIDTPYTAGSSTVSVTGTGVNQTLTQSDGTYDTGQVLESGTYTVSFITLPTNYHMTYPIGSIPPRFTVTIGTPGKSYECSVGTYNDAVCSGSGSISNLNFGMNNEIVFTQGFCTNVRDEVTTQDFIPNTATCGAISGNYAILGNVSCVVGPGVYAAGSITPDFGFGQASANNWLIGGATPENFSPVNPGVIRTSSSYLRTTIRDNGLKTNDLTDVCSNSSCYLPDNLPSGVYVWPYDTTFQGTHNTATNTDTGGTYTFPTGKNYVFVIGDDTNNSSITFKTKMLVPNGSTATFVAAKDIFVDPSVGESDITSTAGDLEGFYSADESFIIQSAYAASNRCTDSGGTKDLRFNLIGSVVVNAAGNGGTLVNQRDLCAGDLSCPTFTTGNGGGGVGGNSGDTTGTQLGLTYILNAPQIIKHKNTFWQELAP